MAPRVRDNNPLCTSLDFVEEVAREGSQKTLKNFKLITLSNSRRRHMAEIMTRRCKTLSNQSINQSIIHGLLVKESILPNRPFESGG